MRHRRRNAELREGSAKCAFQRPKSRLGRNRGGSCYRRDLAHIWDEGYRSSKPDSPSEPSSHACALGRYTPGSSSASRSRYSRSQPRRARRATMNRRSESGSVSMPGLSARRAKGCVVAGSPRRPRARPGNDRGSREGAGDGEWAGIEPALGPFDKRLRLPGCATLRLIQWSTFFFEARRPRDADSGGG